MAGLKDLLEKSKVVGTLATEILSSVMTKRGYDNRDALSFPLLARVRDRCVSLSAQIKNARQA